MDCIFKKQANEALLGWLSAEQIGMLLPASRPRSGHEERHSPPKVEQRACRDFLRKSQFPVVCKAHPSSEWNKANQKREIQSTEFPGSRSHRLEGSESDH